MVSLQQATWSIVPWKDTRVSIYSSFFNQEFRGLVWETGNYYVFRDEDYVWQQYETTSTWLLREVGGIKFVIRLPGLDWITSCDDVHKPAIKTSLQELFVQHYHWSFADHLGAQISWVTGFKIANEWGKVFLKYVLHIPTLVQAYHVP